MQMADLLHIAAGERGTIRIFSVEMDASARHKILHPKPDTAPTGAALGALLGIDWIDPDHAELFDVSDLDDLGLMGFLSQGAGVSEKDLDPHRALLDGLKGTLLIVFARGFENSTEDLRPAANVTPILYLSEATTPVHFEPLESQASEGTLSASAPASQSPHLTVLVAILALPILALILGAVLWGLMR